MKFKEGDYIIYDSYCYKILSRIIVKPYKRLLYDIALSDGYCLKRITNEGFKPATKKEIQKYKQEQIEEQIWLLK